MACGGNNERRHLAACSDVRRAACGGRRAACGVQRAATTETAMHGRRRRAAMCGSSPLEATAILFDVRYSTLLFLCTLERQEEKNESER
jgi:hypothetical protein